MNQLEFTPKLENVIDVDGYQLMSLLAYINTQGIKAMILTQTGNATYRVTLTRGIVWPPKR